MRTCILRVFSVLLIVVFCFAQSSTQSSAQTNPPSSIPREIPIFDLNAIDKTIDPCVDFYQYSCGNWMKNNPIPPDKSRWGRFNELFERNLYILRDILTDAQLPGKHSRNRDQGRRLTTPRAWTRARSRKRALLR